MIPKIIHQYWADGVPFPAEYARYAALWREKNPDWQYVRWTDQSLFPLYNQERYLWTLETPELTNSFRSALVRFEVLHRYGGIWFDPQMECLNPININLDTIGFVVDESASVIGASPNADFLWEIVVRLKQDKHALNNTALAVWHLYHVLLSHAEVTRIPVCKFFPHDKQGNVRCDLSQALTTYHW